MWSDQTRSEPVRDQAGARTPSAAMMALLQDMMSWCLSSSIWTGRGNGRVIQIGCVIVNGGRLSGYIVSVQGKAFGYSQGCAYRKWCRHILGSMGDPFTSESHLLSCITTLACPGRDRIMRIAISVTLKFFTLQFLLRKSGIISA